MVFLIFVLIFACLTSAVQHIPPLWYPISNQYCPVLPEEQRWQCGRATASYCEECDTCTSPVPATLLEFEDPRAMNITISPEEYLFYKMIETEYLVEFSKKPMSWETPITLTYCGLQRPQLRERRFRIPTLNEVRSGPENLLKAGGKVVEQVGSLKEKFIHGVATIPLPWLDKPPGKPVFPRPICMPSTIAVPIHFTVFVTNLTTAYDHVPPATLEEQVKRTNAAYEPLGISFYIATINYHVGEEFRRFTQHFHSDPDPDPKWTRDSERIKMRNRYGGNDEVNVWIVESIDKKNCEKGTVKNGYCNYASVLTNVNHNVDGCVIGIHTLPNSTYRGGVVGQGKTLSHELGHWFNLRHVFASKKEGLCSGPSDGIFDTFKFPNDNNEMYKSKQRPCCNDDYCPGSELHVANYMSYSSDKGNLIPGDQLGTKPWTKGQRAAMFSAFFTLRRTAPDGTKPVDCDNWIVFPDDYADFKPALKERSFSSDIRKVLRGDFILRQADEIMETLKRVCSSPPDQNSNKAIDMISGEVVTCHDSGNCDPPLRGPSCLDDSLPPCKLIDVCWDGSAPPCRYVYVCDDGTAPPCSSTTCPDGAAPQCLPPNTQGTGNIWPDGPCPITPSPPKCPNGTDPPCEPAPFPLPGNVSTCPRPCDVHYNSCDPTTAPTCIFPDPRIAYPRAACACRPGYKSSEYADSDTTKQWRLPIVGQEHRVWVAESVLCDKICNGYGVDSCKEVAELGKECVG
ncbi:hypothetical protein K469DRAFT_798613 [Zopfia rhizophila CBS 207.26]|uniref:Peptidase M43 pregnancy-associated plasma-A domain-containing protein n=1 Tax=Zopfia rhizophila CBS 207.26 TaxID=1314779 RepID=A0A6A6DJC1_9PEZI|nr:hypothetical protein K469DRAFT_798613 [Zopfia rhizophila CBS 207.26]